MNIKLKPYQVWYEVEIDNGFEYLTDVRYREYSSHLEACQFADRLREENEATNIVVDHLGWDFYVPGAESYTIQMLDSYEEDETVVAGPMPFIDALRELMKFSWANKFDWVSYKLVHYVQPAAPVPPAPDCYAEDDELPF